MDNIEILAYEIYNLKDKFKNNNIFNHNEFMDALYVILMALEFQEEQKKYVGKIARPIDMIVPIQIRSVEKIKEYSVKFINQYFAELREKENEKNKL